MQFRTFPKLPGVQVSTLGFGCMRLPLLDADPAHIDEEAATALLHEAIESGVSYVDTARPYHAGASEPFVFSFYNAARMFASKAGPARVYEMFLRSAGTAADRCIECGECLSKCPQSIAIPDRLKEAHAHLTVD